MLKLNQGWSGVVMGKLNQQKFCIWETEYRHQPLWKKLKNGRYFINMCHMEKIQITDHHTPPHPPPPKVSVSGFLSVNRNGISASAILKTLKNGCHFINMHHMENFQITDPQSLGLPHESPMCSFTLPDILNNSNIYTLFRADKCDAQYTLKSERSYFSWI